MNLLPPLELSHVDTDATRTAGRSPPLEQVVDGGEVAQIAVVSG
jgi:hypothetical protein